MPIISIQTDYVRYVGRQWQEFQRTAFELRQFVQLRILSNPRYVAILGPAVYEFQEIVRRVNNEELLIETQVRELFGVADRADAANSITTYRPAWFTPTLFGSTELLRGRVFISNLYRQPVRLINIGRLIYGGYNPVNVLARQGTYVNIADTTA